MKKILAIMLALMLLLASAALAETATVVSVSNPVLSITSDGETQNIDLAGFEIEAAIGNAGEVPTIQAVVTKDGEKLLDAVMQVLGSRVVVDVEGMSRPIAAEIPAGETAGESIGQLFAALPELSNFRLPAFTGVTIPKLDLMSLGQMIGAGADGSFEVPYEMVNAVLSQLSQFKDAIPDSAKQYTDMIFDLIDQLQATNSGIALKGQITDDGATSALTIDVLPVSQGVTADEAAVILGVSSAENQFNITVDFNQDGQIMNLGEFALTSVPADATLSFELDVMSGSLNLAGSLYPDNGAQVVAFELNIMGQKANLSLTYGGEGDTEFADFAFSVDGEIAMDCYAETTSDGNGNENGNLQLTVETTNPENQLTLDAGIAQTISDVTFRTIDNAADAIDAENMTDEEQARISEELEAATGSLMMAVMEALMPAA